MPIARSSRSSSSSEWCVCWLLLVRRCDRAAQRPLRFVVLVIANDAQPCIGKTTFYQHWFQPRGYVAVSTHVNGNLGKMLAAIREAIGAGKSVVVDEPNGTGA